MSTPDTSIKKELTLQEIARLVGGTPYGSLDTRITGLASIDEAQPGELVFAESSKYLATALRSQAGAILAPAEADVQQSAKPIILVADPRRAFVQVLEMFAPTIVYSPGIHPSANIGEGTSMGEGIHIGANVTVGDAVTLEANVVILPGACIGDGCHIGEGTILHPNVILYPGTIVGKRCLIQSGSVIGSEGFGFVPLGSRLKRVPHLGIVQLGDEVEIGANVAIDRAKTGATVIGSGTKIDNLVHIAHNVHIGMSCILISQVGLAGSVKLGNGVILAGQVGIIPHIQIGDGVRVAAQSGLMNDVPAGETWFGSPALPHSHRLKEIAASRKLPETMKQIRTLEKRVAELEKQLNGLISAQTSTEPARSEYNAPIIAEETDGTGFEQSAGKDVGPVG